MAPLGYSKSMLGLQRILRIIALYPSQEAPKDGSSSSQIQENRLFTGEKRGLDIDLNVGLCEQESDSVITACSVVDRATREDSSTVGFSGDRKSSEGECDDPHTVDTQSRFGAATEREDNDKSVCLRERNDGLSLLVEATETVSNEEHLQKAKGRSKRKLKEDLSGGSSPILRSKRSKVMPSRYRDDSILLELPRKKNTSNH